MLWSYAEIADAVHAGLTLRAQQDDLEQAVYGFDVLDELGLHPLLQEAFVEAGFGVWPEQRYPSDRHRARGSEGRRCDIVLTPSGTPLRQPLAKRTLFDPEVACELEQAYWLEVKTVSQFDQRGPFRRYSAELMAPLAADVRKLWQDASIYHAGLLLVLFTEDRKIAEHDLAAWHRHCLDHGYPVNAPAVRGLPISDRIGNGYCTAAVFPVRGG